MTPPNVTELQKENGNPINSCIFHPSGEANAVIVICNAIGIHQNYYRKFAEWLCDNDFIVITFDFTGTGQHGRNEIRNADIDLMTWVNHDCKAAIDLAIEAANGKPIYWIGHSFGGQILGYISNHKAISKAIFVATGEGYWGNASLSMKLQGLLFWYFITPICTTLLPYFPGRKLRLIGDMPNGALLQWRRWCLTPDYVYGAIDNSKSAYDSVNIPIYSITLTDDAMISKRATEALLGKYRHADITRIEISPEEASDNKIGHLGFFNAKNKSKLWETYMSPLL